ncbi:MAG: tetratricopeptide repeat protein [Tenuifilaceae bacterium]
MNKHIGILLLFISILIISKTNAQNAKVDSLENLLKVHQIDDTVKVNLLNKIAYGFYSKDVIKMRSYANQANELADKLKFLKGKIESNRLIGVSYSKTDKPLSIEYFQKALKIAQDIKYVDGIAKCLNSLGIYYKAQGENEKAIECYQKGIKMYEDLGDKLKVANWSQSISMIYRAIGNYDDAIDGFQKALKIFEELDEKSEVANCLNSLGIIYAYQGNYPLALESFQKYLKIKEELSNGSVDFQGLINIGNIYLSLLDYPQALEHFQKALKIAEEQKADNKISNSLANIGYVYLKTNNLLALEYFQNALKVNEKRNDKLLIISTLIYIGDFYFQRGDFDNAMANYSKAQGLADELGKKRPSCEALNKIGTIYLKQKKYSAALSYTLKSLAIANELKLLDTQKDIRNQLSEIYAATNDYRNAYINHKLYKAINDSLFSEENVKKITGLEYTYKHEKEKQTILLEQQKKDAIQAAEKKQQRIIIFFLIVGFILVSFIAVFVYQSYKSKSRTNIILTKQKREIEELNEEYQAVNEELIQSNEQLYYTKNLVEESEEKLKLLIKNSNDIFVQVNEKGEQFFISDVAKDLTGYSVEELLGLVKDVIHPDDLVIVEQHWKRVLSDKNTADTVQYRHKHKEKGYVWFEAVAQNFLDQPAINSVVANIRDITERKKIEQALKESEAEKARLLALEIERINQELESNQKSITAATLKLIQNAERDAQTIERLIEVEKNTNQEGKNIINTLISDYKRLSYNSNWDEFEMLFEKVHKSFYEKLNSQFPNLTANERKICAFLKLNMSSKDIAQITFQSEEALKKARLRLRQKLEIDREVNLVTFIQNV